MAAPASKTLRDLSGKWQIDKTLGDSPDPVFAIQGINWFTRKGIGLATVTLHISTSTTPPSSTSPSTEPTPSITIDQFATGGIKGTTEHRTLDWTWRPHSDWLFGSCRGHSRFNTLADIKAEVAGTPREPFRGEDVEFLTEGWLAESVEGEVIDNVVENLDAGGSGGWAGWQVWGFAEVGGKGERFFVRRFVVRRGESVACVRLVYAWLGEL
ncbi:hypothetical protein P154DRAFT_555743 [Amniculicola lignicola CBS 123094]|uniref:Lipocalin-like domain-containing protein n=1 Tax=Amniculicola lignicola CBS 123094 TaxID=1392246 RepID=A0A6A5W7U1_9PLEO|nr:hypothetical protein P154DRAFT_555743 [Amniculicola lignicola CBS 123094]